MTFAVDLMNKPLPTETFIAASDIAPACACGNTVHTYHATADASYARFRDFALVAQCYACRKVSVLGESDDAERYHALTAAECRARHEEYSR